MWLSLIQDLHLNTVCSRCIYDASWWIEKEINRECDSGKIELAFNSSQMCISVIFENASVKLNCFCVASRRPLLSLHVEYP